MARRERRVLYTAADDRHDYFIAVDPDQFFDPIEALFLALRSSAPTDRRVRPPRS